MAEIRSTMHSVLLIGSSLYLAAVEASLRLQQGLEIRRQAIWQPAALHSDAPPDAIIVDSIAAQMDAMSALLAAYPEILVIELQPGEQDQGRAIVRYGERRVLGTAQDLAQLITGGIHNGS